MEMELIVTYYRFGRKDAYQHTKNCDDSWVVTTEGPRGPKCTESARALIGRSARIRRESTRALKNTSARALRKSTRTLNRSTRAEQ